MNNFIDIKYKIQQISYNTIAIRERIIRSIRSTFKASVKLIERERGDYYCYEDMCLMGDNPNGGTY
jgi:hypothetical protein